MEYLCSNQDPTQGPPPDPLGDLETFYGVATWNEVVDAENRRQIEALRPHNYTERELLSLRVGAVLHPLGF